MKKKYLLSFLLCIGLVLFDQITKFLVVRLIPLNGEITIIKNFFRLLYIRNTGGAFGILNSNLILLIGISIILIYYIITELKNSENNKLLYYTYLIILSGAFGNMIDRIFRGYVVDFISFKLIGKEMAIFNIADIYITLGILVLIYKVLKGEKNERSNNNRRK